MCRCFLCLRFRRSRLLLLLLLLLLWRLLSRLLLLLRLRRLRSLLPRLRDLEPSSLLLADSLPRLSDPLSRSEPAPSGPASAPSATASRSPLIRPECPIPAGAPRCARTDGAFRRTLAKLFSPRHRGSHRHKSTALIPKVWRPASPPSRPRSASRHSRATPRSPALARSFPFAR